MLTNLPSLNALKAFTAAAQFKSFKKAGALLNVSPTAISHQIRALESSLKVTLFDRHVRAVTLTAEGIKLEATTSAIFKQLSNTIEEISSPVDKVRISCCTSFAALWLAPKLAELSQQLGKVEIEICASDSLIDLSTERHIDIALRYGDRKTQQDSEQDVFLTSETLHCYGTKNLTADKNTLFVTQWENNSLLKNLDWKTPIGKHKLAKLLSVKTYDQEQYVIQAALAGQGIALVSDILSVTSVQQGWLHKRNDLPSFKGYDYWLRVSPYSQHKHQVRLVSEWLKSALQE